MPVPGCPPSLERPPQSLRWWIFAVVLAADVLDLIDATVTTIAAPAMVRSLGGSDGLIPWLGLSYALALGSLLVVGGRLGDRFGQRRTFLVGLVGFTVASLCCGWAWSPAPVIVFRLIQGAFGALLIPQGFSILLATFPRNELGRVFGLFGPLMAVGAISGPMLAGLLIHADLGGTGWRSIFLINGVIGAAILFVGRRVLPHTVGNPAVRIDPVASALVMLGLLGIMGGLITGPESGWRPASMVPLLVGLVLIGAFVAQQRRSENPLLARSLFRVRSFVAGIAVGSAVFAAVSGLLYVVSLYLQRGAGASPFVAAAVMAPLSVGIIITSFLVRDRIQRLGRRLVLAGLVLTMLGVGAQLAAVAMFPHRAIALTIPLFVTGLGMGCCFGALFSTALGDVDKVEAGSASGTLNALQQVANATGAAVVSTVFVTWSISRGIIAATTLCLASILVVLIVAAVMTPTLPRRGAADQH